jgi:hypothetical protein
MDGLLPSGTSDESARFTLVDRCALAMPKGADLRGFRTKNRAFRRDRLSWRPQAESGVSRMPVELNHTIVWCRDKQTSAAFLAGILGRPDPKPFMQFMVVDLDNGVSLDFMEKQGDVALRGGFRRRLRPHPRGRA